MAAMRAHEITAKPKSGYQALAISPGTRDLLARTFPPQFSEWVGHHVTLKFKSNSDQSLPDVKSVEVVGYARNDAGIEALVVSVDGTTDRPDGGTYHLTWSLDREAGFKPVNSNQLIQSGWQKIDPINISATARFFTHNY